MDIIVNNNRLYYEEHGNRKGETIFFIHGAPGLGDCRGDIKAFSKLGDTHRLIFLDMRGSGRSEDKRPFTHEQWTADIEAVRLELIGKPIIILGGSYGGFLSLEYAIRYPNSVSKVVLRDTAATHEFDQDSVQQALDANLDDVTEDEIIRLFEGEVHSNEELKRVFTAIQPLYTVEFDKEAVQKKMDSIYYRYETHNDAFKYNKPSYHIVSQLENIKVPMLVTVGRHDWITPVVCSEQITEHVPNAILHIFENSGHSPHHEENEEYLKLVKTFLNC
ncbi:alpha/beta fold hydrolase [Alkalicoccobacillus porphyridii]|uniref:Alpha/beta hydrolase n=1 Tax=Alkalicoccobacillus porphyridii TaxID=2597270 RepID=A0A554A243_9BACI|nr:alpha/beta hydrolase [Alkalicoccobacillus porphyridii]TSB47716.1 alpha/beta hydrolase [Alkalicoccobacillus porphyridii]